MINWKYYPSSDRPPQVIKDVVSAFEVNASDIDSSVHKKKSDEVLATLRSSLERLEFRVEKSKKSEDMIKVPVLFGREGSVSKSFRADAFSEKDGFVLEIEAGRAVMNNAFLKDLFQACMMHDVRYFGVAVRNIYEGGSRRSKDFENIIGFFDALYASQRLDLPFEGMVAIGY